MEITFLGTGTSQGVPPIGCACRTCQSLDHRDKRLRSSIHVQINGKSFVIDTGPDFRQQILANNIQSLDAILYTHQHKDHTAGMDDIRGFNFKQQRDMPIFATASVLEQLKMEFSYVFMENKYPGAPGVEVHVIENKPFYIEDIQILPIQAMHYKLPVLGFRIQNFTYLTDANFLESVEIDKIRGSEVFVINGLQFEKHISHFSIDEAIELVEEIKPKAAYITHISHRLGRYEEVQSRLPDNIFLAYDGLRITL